MSRRVRTSAILFLVALLPWIGILQALPHDHADALVPQEALACSASSPTSHEAHLHDVGRLLTSHRCLACLAGSAQALDAAAEKVEVVPPVVPLGTGASTAVRSRICSDLPLVRGPPAAV